MNKLVTAIYLGLFNTEYGGRPPAWRTRYFNGIIQLKNNNFQKIVYTSSKLSSDIQAYINKNCTVEQANLFTVKVFELDQFVHHSKIIEIKQAQNIKHNIDRCIHVQWLKFWLLNKELEANNYVFWIDAGLIDHILFPCSTYKNLTNIINQTYLENLIKRINDKTFIITGDRNKGFTGPTGPPSLKSLKNYNLHPIGGFFGGLSTSLEKTIKRYELIIEQYLNNKTLYFEEAVMEDDFLHNTDEYIFDTFDTWYHENTKWFNQKQLEKIKSFHKVFYN